MKLILSCPKPTPNSVRMLEVASLAMEALAAPTAAIAIAIAEIAHSLTLHLWNN